jgi:hypothetical protein
MEAEGCFASQSHTFIGDWLRIQLIYVASSTYIVFLLKRRHFLRFTYFSMIWFQVTKTNLKKNLKLNQPTVFKQIINIY